MFHDLPRAQDAHLVERRQMLFDLIHQATVQTAISGAFEEIRVLSPKVSDRLRAEACASLDRPPLAPPPRPSLITRLMML